LISFSEAYPRRLTDIPKKAACLGYRKIMLAADWLAYEIELRNPTSSLGTYPNTHDDTFILIMLAHMTLKQKL